MSSGGEPPAGWDEPNEEMIALGRALRQMYLGYMAAGFTMAEAAMIIGSWLAASGNSQNSIPGQLG